jgi:ADP-heptose:LPS heptosyltransferase
MRRLVEAIEWLFRHLVAYPLLRLLFRNEYSDRTLDIRNVRKILILRFDRIGDMIVTTPIFRVLKQQNPKLHLGVLTSHGNAEIIRYNQNVDAIYILHRNWWRMWREIQRARSVEYDVVLNFIFNRTSSAGILANLIAPRGFKVGQGDDKYRFYFNRLLKLDRTQAHMVEVLAGYTETVFGISIPRSQLQFEISIDLPSRHDVDAFLRKTGLRRRSDTAGSFLPYCVVNISTTEEVRAPSYAQCLAIVKHLLSRSGYAVVVVGAPSMRGTVESIVRQVGSDRCVAFPEKGTATLVQLASLIEGAAAIVTPDTSIIHFASATQTPVLGLFTPLQRTHEWMPYRVQHATLFAPEGKPVSAIAIERINAAIDDFLHATSSLRNDEQA